MFFVSQVQGCTQIFLFFFCREGSEGLLKNFIYARENRPNTIRLAVIWGIFYQPIINIMAAIIINAYNSYSFHTTQSATNN